MEVCLVLVIRLLIVLVATVPADFDTVVCDGTKVTVCRPNLPQYNISCICRASSTHCFWTTFANRSNMLTNDTIESRLVWHSNTLGYGQFTCISRNSSFDDTDVERNVLIIPNVQRTSCDGCITTRICRTATGKYLMQFSKLFNQSLLAGNCELCYTNHSLPHPNGTINEEDCVELLPSFNYCIQCPICYPHTHTIYYEISISDIENCSDSDTCSSQPSTTTTTSAMNSSIASETTTTYFNSTMATTSTSFAVTTTMNMSDVSNDSNENNDGIIIAAVVGVVAVVLLIMTIIIMCIVLFYRHNHNIKKKLSATNEVAISTSSEYIDKKDNAEAASNETHTKTSDTITIKVGPSVIIYSQDDNPDNEIERLVVLLRNNGVDCDIDQYHTHDKISNWNQWWEETVKQIAEENGFILLVCSPTLMECLSKKEIVPMKEGFISCLLLSSFIENRQISNNLIPIFLDQYIADCMPMSLSQRKNYALMICSLAQNDLENLKLTDFVNNPEFECLTSLYRKLTGQPEVQRPPIARIR